MKLHGCHHLGTELQTSSACDHRHVYIRPLSTALYANLCFKVLCVVSITNHQSSWWFIFEFTNTVKKSHWQKELFTSLFKILFQKYFSYLSQAIRYLFWEFLKSQYLPRISFFNKRMETMSVILKPSWLCKFHINETKQCFSLFFGLNSAHYQTSSSGFSKLMFVQVYLKMFRHLSCSS